MVRERVGQLINQQTDMLLCGEAESAAQALDVVRLSKPDVAIIDISLKASNGLDLVKDLKHQHPKLCMLVLSMHDDSLYAERALLAGAMGYINKQELTEKVIEAIRMIRTEQIYLGTKMTANILRKFVAPPAVPDGSPLARLSDRELAVFELIGRGRKPSQIAIELRVSVKTVESYCARIKAKLALANAAALAQHAKQWIQTSHSSATNIELPS
jgi:DNA-binding NarL/FixJ family response regulator